MNLLFIFVLALYHQVSAVPLSLSEIRNSTGNRVDTESLDNVTRVSEINNYFHASKQIFYVSSNCSSPTEERKPEIPNDYSIVPGLGAYKIHIESKTWNEARNVCIQEGAHLVVLRSPEEKNLIEGSNQKNNIHESWLGIHELFGDKDWTTVLDEPLGAVGYTYWAPGEPNNAGGIEHCGSYKTSNGMNDVTCSRTMSFYCKIDLE